MIPIKDDNPTERFPLITVLIIAANVVAFFYQISLGSYGQYFVFRAGLVPYELTHFRDLDPPNVVPLPFTLLSSLFLHGGVAHLVGNMLYLWIFGNNVEDSMGRKRFVFFYLLCGVLASLTQIVMSPSSRVPVIGASGAIAGILGGYIVLFPRARVLTLVPIFFFIQIIKLPAVFVLGVWFLFQLLSAGGGGGVAWFAHIGGFLMGAFLIRFFAGRRKGRVRYYWGD